MSGRLLTGPNAVLSALESGVHLRRIMVAEGEVGSALRRVLGRAGEAAIPVRRASRRELDRMADGAAHQGVVAEAPPFAYSSIQEIAAALVASGEAAGIALALDGIQDPQNLGAILRSAAAFGVAGVLIPEHGACEVTAATERASAGAASRVRVARVTNLAKALDALKGPAGDPRGGAGAWVATADARGGQDPADADPPFPLVLVMGSESKGVRPGVAKRADLSLTLPLSDAVESLNVSVATAVLLYALRLPCGP